VRNPRSFHGPGAPPQDKNGLRGKKKGATFTWQTDDGQTGRLKGLSRAIGRKRTMEKKKNWLKGMADETN